MKIIQFKKICWIIIMAWAAWLCPAMFSAIHLNAKDLVYAKDRDKQLIIGVGRDFYDGPDSRSFLHGSTNTWEGLTYIDEKMRAVPWLAESWEHSDDGMTWTFYLRPGVRFHDNTFLNAPDAVFSINRIKSHSKYDPADNYKHLVSVKAKGDREIIFQLDKPIPYFPKLLAYYSSPVIKPEYSDEKGHIKNLVATGPYKVEEIKPGSEIRLSVFKDYWGKKPEWPEVIFRYIPDAQTRLLALMAGEIDVVADVGGILPEQAVDLKSFPDIELKRQEVATTHIMLFNCAIPPFSKTSVRLWLSGILERENILKAFVGDAGIPASDPYSGLAEDFAFSLIKIQNHPKPEFSFKEKIRILLHSGTLQRWPYLEIAQIIQEKLRKHGLYSKIEIREAGAFHEAVKTGDFNMVIQPYTLMTGDPDFFYAYWISSDSPKNPGWHNKEADRLISAARHEMDKTRRQELYRNLQEIINKNLPLCPLYHDVSFYAYQKKAGYFVMDHFFKPLLLNAKRN